MKKFNLKNITRNLKGFNLKGFTGTLKAKLIASFALIVLVTGAVSIVSFFTLKDCISEFDLMVETTVLANDIVKCSKNITGYTSKFILEREPEVEKQIHEELFRIDNDVKRLQKYVVDAESKKSLDGVSRLCTAFRERVLGTVKKGVRK